MERTPEVELMDVPEEARAYARGNFPGFMEAVVARLSELAEGATGVKMVDLGTGPGTLPILIAQKHPTWHITAVDAAKSMLRIAQISVKMAKLSDRVTVQLADAKHTGLADQSFDIVFSCSVLHHMPDAVPFWLEIKRLAKPGGMIFVRDLARPASEEAAKALVAKHAAAQSPMMQKEFYESLLSAFTMDEVRAQLAAAGLAHLQVVPVPDRSLDVFGRMPAA